MAGTQSYSHSRCFTVLWATLFTFGVVCSVAVALILSPVPFVSKLMLPLEDTKTELRAYFQKLPTPSPQVVVVEIDESSINRFGRWPWNRELLASLLEKMSGARLVVLDIVFSESSNPHSDARLAEVISHNDNVILGFFFRPNATQQVDERVMDALQECAINRYELLSERVGVKEFPHIEANIPSISQAALSCASFTTEPDVDGRYRHYPLVQLFQGEIYPSLAIQAVRYGLNTDIKLKLDENGVRQLNMGEVEINQTNRLSLNFYNRVNTLSAADVLTGAVEAKTAFDDKIILLGLTETGIFDMRPTPLDAYTPGVHLHYTAINNLLDRRFLRHSALNDVWVTTVFLLVLTIIGFLEALRQRLLLYATVFSVLIGGINGVLIQYHLDIALAPALIFGVLLVMLSEFLLAFRMESQSAVLKKAFSSYVEPKIVNQIIKNRHAVTLSGEQREISILFSDIRGFTSISEQLPPEQLVHLLNTYLAPMSHLVFKHHGLLDKYIGDAIMALFNTPLPLDHFEDSACQCALDMLDSLVEVNQKLVVDALPEISIGIGIHTGIATVGNIGSDVKFDYTAIGDAVNLSSRIESLCKNYHVPIIISEDTKTRIHDRFLTRKLDRVRVKGKNIPVNIYQLLPNNEKNRHLCQQFKSALSAYFDAEFTQARARFQQLEAQCHDQVSSLFYERCNLYENSPPAADWDGVFVFSQK
jgi:adenylate cyclase